MPVNQETLARIENRMKELVNENLPIEKHSIPVEEAIEHFTEHGMTTKHVPLSAEAPGAMYICWMALRTTIMDIWYPVPGI